MSLCKKLLTIFGPLHFSTSRVGATVQLRLNKRFFNAMAPEYKGSPFDAKVTSVEKLNDGKWIQTRKIAYKDPKGVDRDWEMAIRTTRPSTSTVDGVAIAALLKSKNEPVRVLLTKQFRPPIDKVCIDFPAGLVDPKETVESTAIRELHEETGYYGTLNHLSNPEVMLASDPGLTNATMALVFLDVDLEDARNKNPEPKLEETEFIDTIIVPVKDLLPELMRLGVEEGCAIDSRLYNFAVGSNFAFSLKE